MTLPSDVIKHGIERAPDRSNALRHRLEAGRVPQALDRGRKATPCNFHNHRLAGMVKEGIPSAGGLGKEFNTSSTISVTDGIAMGTRGMKASLASHELIADSMERCVRAPASDAVVAIGGCDKTNPGGLMGLARLNVHGIFLHGGSIMPGNFRRSHPHEAGGAPMTRKALLDGDCLTVTGKTVRENLAGVPWNDAQDVLRPLSSSLHPAGAMVILRGNLPPDGCVMKLGELPVTFHTGPARVFDGEKAGLLLPCGGPIRLAQDGDRVSIDAESRRIHLGVPDGELDRRCQRWTAPAPRYTWGAPADYAMLVGSSAEGDVCEQSPAGEA